MAVLMMRHRWTWGGFSGAPGYSTFYGLGTAAQAFADGIRAFLLSGLGGASGFLPTGVNIVPDGAVDLVQDSDGHLDSSQSITPPANVGGTAAATYGSPMGVSVTWTTAGIATGPAGRPRRVRGRTFFVPASGASFDLDGTPKPVPLAALNSAAATYIAGAWKPCVWHRPFPKGGTNGASFQITAGQAQDRASILRSRRA